MTSGHFFPDKIALPEAIAALLEKCRGKRRALLPRRASWWNGLGNLEAACPMNGVGPGGTPPIKVRRYEDLARLVHRHRECPHRTENATAPNASAGYGRRYWGPTTGSCRRRAWCWAWRRRMRRTATYWSRGWPPWSPGRCPWQPGRRMRRTATYWSRGWPPWSPGRCPWQPVSTCRCTHRQTPKGPTSSWNARSEEHTSELQS